MIGIGPFSKKIIFILPEIRTPEKGARRQISKTQGPKCPKKAFFGTHMIAMI